MPTAKYWDGASWRPLGAGGSRELSQLPVLDTGVAGHTRAGRVLTVADFTNLGLSQPIGLWNLSSLTNLGSDGRSLANKGSVPFGKGVTGAASEAAVFAGAPSQALYIADSGAADPYRIRTGSWGCWFRTAKRGTQQFLLSKWRVTGNQRSWTLDIAASGNVLEAVVSPDGSGVGGATGVTDACDDRWHFAVAVHDGTWLRLYIDGVLDGVQGTTGGVVFGGTAPLNVGAYDADGSTNAASPHYGRVDEAFITADVLSEDQIRMLYAVKLAHGLGATPRDARVNVKRRRRGAALATSDFTTQPLRLHNFTGGALTDQGSGNVPLTNNGSAVSVAGADGSSGGAYSFAGAQSLSATDAGLPSGTATRSYGCWLKTTTVAGGKGVVSWGTPPSAYAMLYVTSAGMVTAENGADSITGPFVADGQWHFAIIVEDNAAGDGVRRKLYLDGRLVGGSTVLNSITLAGANRFRIGAQADGAAFFTGQIDGAFVCNYALAADEIAALYAKGSQQLAPSPKNAGDHLEGMDATNVYVIADTLESQHVVDVGVAV